MAHLSYTYGLNGLGRPEPWAVNVTDEASIRADAAWAKENGAEFVILSLHWGVERHVPPTAGQEALARSLLEDSDVDLILGTHAHVIQPIDRIGDKVVVYGMGNSLSNQFTRWGLPYYYATEDGVVVHLTVTEVDGRFVVTDTSFTPTTVEWATYRVMASDYSLAIGGFTRASGCHERTRDECGQGKAAGPPAMPVGMDATSLWDATQSALQPWLSQTCANSAEGCAAASAAKGQSVGTAGNGGGGGDTTEWDVE